VSGTHFLHVSLERNMIVRSDYILHQSLQQYLLVLLDSTRTDIN